MNEEEKRPSAVVGLRVVREKDGMTVAGLSVPAPAREGLDVYSLEVYRDGEKIAEFDLCE